MLVAVFLSVLTVPVVTIFPAYVAAVLFLRRSLTGRSDTVMSFWHDFKQVFTSGGWKTSLVSAGLILLFAFGYTYANFGMLPVASKQFSWLVAIMAVLSYLVFLKYASLYASDSGSRKPVQRIESSLTNLLSHPSNTVLLVVAVLLCAVFIWMLIPLFLIVQGLMVFALVATEHKSGERALD